MHGQGGLEVTHSRYAHCHVSVNELHSESQARNMRAMVDDSICGFAWLCQGMLLELMYWSCYTVSGERATSVSKIDTSVCFEKLSHWTLPLTKPAGICTDCCLHIILFPDPGPSVKLKASVYVLVLPCLDPCFLEA